HINGVENGFQIDVASVQVLPDRADENGPLNVLSCLFKVELGQGPVLLVACEPEIGPVVPDVGHRVGLGRDERLQSLDVSVSAASLGLGGRWSREPTAPPVLHSCSANHRSGTDKRNDDETRKTLPWHESISL